MIRIVERGGLRFAAEPLVSPLCQQIRPSVRWNPNYTKSPCDRFNLTAKLPTERFFE